MHDFDPSKTALTGNTTSHVPPRNPWASPVAGATPNADSVLGKPMEQMLSQDQTLGPVPFFGAPPTEMPGYRILEELGRGGMGVVYKAVQEGLDRVVALKMILGHVNEEKSLRRFADEAVILGRLDHPHIVKIFDCGDHQGMPFLALEYIAGGSMSDRLQNQPIPSAAAARVCQTLAETIAYAHEHGIIHRDLKPGNVLLATKPCEVGQSEQTELNGAPTETTDFGNSWWLAHLKITDFGLAKRPREVQLTATNELLGTPCYMAPEQAFGFISKVGTSADIYALGAILYELLTGRPPFVGETMLRVLEQLGTDEPIPPRRLRLGIPQDLETICLKCLEKEPNRRYPTAKALAEELGRFLAGESIQSRPVSHWEWAWRWLRRRPALTALALALVLVSLLGIGGVVWQWRVAVAERNDAQDKEISARAAKEDARKARDNEAEARRQAVSSLYSSNLARARLEFERNDTTSALRVLDRCPKELRGWEWHFQRHLCQAALTEVNARHSHAGWILDLAYSPDGNTLLTAGGGNPFFKSHGPGSVVAGEVKSWHTQTAAEQASIGSHRQFVYWVGWSGDGSKIASVSADHLLQVWNVSNRQLLHSIPNVYVDLDTYRAPVTFVGEGKEMLLVEAQGQLVSYDLQLGVRKELGVHSHAPRALAVDKKGLRLALTERSSIGIGIDINVWNRAGMRRIPLDAVLGNYGDVALNESGNLVAATRGNTIQVWSLSDTAGSLRFTMVGHDAAVRCIAISPDQRFLASGSDDATVILWSLVTGELVGRFRQHSGPVTGVAFHPSGDRLASCGQDGKWLEWDLTSTPACGDVAMVPLVSRTNIEAVALTPDAQMMIMVRGGLLQQMDLRTQWTTEKHQVDLQGEWFTPARVAHFDRAGKRVAGIAGSDRRLTKVWDVASGKELLTVPPQPGLLRNVLLSGNGRRVAANAGFGKGADRYEVELQVWDVDKNKKVFQLSPKGAYVSNLALSHAGDLLAVGLIELAAQRDHKSRFNAALEVYRLGSGDRVFRDESSPFVPNAMGFDRSGKLVAMAGIGPTTSMVRTRIVDWERGTYREGTEAPPNPLTLDFSPDGKRLAVFGRIRGGVLDTETLEEVLPLRGRAQLSPNNRSFNPQVLFSDDGQTLAAICDDAKAPLAIWDLPAPGSAATDRAERRAARERQVLCWHFFQGNQALTEGNDSAFLFHAKKKRAGLPKIPDRWPLQFALVTRYAYGSRWRAAGGLYAEIVGANKDFMDPNPYAGAALLLWNGDLPIYQIARQRWLQRAETTTDPHMAIVNTWACTLGPEPAQDLQGTLRHLQSMPTAMLGKELIGPYHHTLGRLHYRSGDYAAAVRAFEESERHRQHWPLAAQNQPLLAMTYHRLGRVDQARAALAKALETKAQVHAQKPTEVAIPWSSSWPDWLSLQLLCRQAEELLAMPPPKGP